MFHYPEVGPAAVVNAHVFETRSDMGYWRGCELVYASGSTSFSKSYKYNAA